MADAQAEAGASGSAGAALNVPDSAPQLRDVGDAPPGEALRTYDTQLGADALLKAFLAEISDVAREAEVQRRVRALRCLSRSTRLTPARLRGAECCRASS